MRILRDFSSRSMQEQAWLVSESWCDKCNEADLGILNPVEFEEDSRVFVEGKCPKCNSVVTTEIIEQHNDTKT